MANSKFNINTEKYSIDGNVELPVNFSNASSLGEMWGGTSNEAEENNDLPDIFQLDINGACASSVPNDEDIPMVTFKNKKKTKFNSVEWRKYQDTQRIIPLQILDILASTMITKKPALYSFNNNNYRMVQIVGTVVSRKSNKENKLTIGVDDGSGCISCIVDNSESEIQPRTDLIKLMDINSKYEAISKEELLQLALLDDATLRARIKEQDKENAFLAAFTTMILEETLKQWEEYPLIADINIGDNIIIVGVVADYEDQRLIFVKHLQRDRNLAEYKTHMIDAMKYKLPN